MRAETGVDVKAACILTSGLQTDMFNYAIELVTA